MDAHGTLKKFPSTNNIFINQTLFHIYSSYLRNTVVPLLNPGSSLPEFSSLTGENSLKAEDKTFTRTYACVERQLKAPISLIISVLVADYTLIMSAYSVVLLAAAWVHRRQQDGALIRLTREY